MKKFWSFTETFSRSALEEFQSQRLCALVRFLARRNSYYRERFRKEELEATSFRGLADLHRLPFSEKKHLQEILETTRPSLPNRDLLRWHQTSGTSGTPTRFPDSRRDWVAYSDLAASALYAMGVRREDTALAAFSYGPHIAFWSYLSGLDRIGTTVVAAGGLTSEARVRLLLDYKVSVLLGTPNYTMHLAAVARAMDVDLETECQVRLIVTSAEPHPMELKQKLRDCWGAAVYDRIGSTETGGIAFECPANPNVYHLQENYLIAEILDQNHRPVAPGEDGELIITTLFRQAMPLIRFRTGSIVRRAPGESCLCGRSFLSLQATQTGVVVRRIDDLRKVRGILISPTEIERIVQEESHLGEHYQVILHTRDHSDEVTLTVESLPNTSPAQLQKMKRGLGKKFQERLLLRFNVEIVEYGSLPRRADKAQKIIDQREIPPIHQ